MDNGYIAIMVWFLNAVTLSEYAVGLKEDNIIMKEMIQNDPKANAFQIIIQGTDLSAPCKGPGSKNAAE